MSLAAKRVWLIVALLLTFAAQAVASVPSNCDMAHSSVMDSAVVMPVPEAMSGHKHHHSHQSQSSLNSSVDEASSTMSADCCQLGGACSMSGCMTISVVPGSSLAFTTPPSAEAIDFFGRSFVSATTTSLYRPPIFR